MPQLRKRGRVWYSDIYIGGQRVRKPLSTDKNFAKKKLGGLMSQSDGARYGHASARISWASFIDRYLAYSRGSKKPATTARDIAALNALERFEKPRKLEVITPEFLERWRGARTVAGKGGATIARDLTAVKAMLRKAVGWGYLEKKDWTSVKSPKTTRRKLLFWTIQQLRVLLKQCRTLYPDKSKNETPHDWVTICMLGARAGLRRGEILNLAWDDIDFKHKMLSVTPKPGWEPKDYEQRHIPIKDDLLAHLKKLPRTTEWVLGDRPSPGVVTTYFRRIVRKAGLKGSLHTARHTFASHLAQAGESLKTIKDLLGHSDMETTEIYAHLCPENYEAAIDKLPKL